MTKHNPYVVTAKVEEEESIKETREAFRAFTELLLFFIERFKDGVQIDDFLALYSDIVVNPEMKALMLTAFEGYQKIPAELKDIDVYESCTLLSDLIAFVPRIVGALKKS